MILLNRSIDTPKLTFNIEKTKVLNLVHFASDFALDLVDLACIMVMFVLIHIIFYHVTQIFIC